MTKSGVGTICISIPHTKFCGDLSPRPPRDLRLWSLHTASSVKQMWLQQMLKARITVQKTQQNWQHVPYPKYTYTDFM